MLLLELGGGRVRSGEVVGDLTTVGCHGVVVTIGFDNDFQISVVLPVETEEPGKEVFSGGGDTFLRSGTGNHLVRSGVVGTPGLVKITITEESSHTFIEQLLVTELGEDIDPLDVFVTVKEFKFTSGGVVVVGKKGTSRHFVGWVTRTVSGQNMHLFDGTLFWHTVIINTPSFSDIVWRNGTHQFEDVTITRSRVLGLDSGFDWLREGVGRSWGAISDGSTVSFCQEWCLGSISNPEETDVGWEKIN